MNCFCQANTDDAYTPSQFLIAANLISIFKLVSRPRVDGFESYEYGEWIVDVKPILMQLTRLPNDWLPHICFEISEGMLTIIKPSACCSELFLRVFPIIDCRASAFDDLACKLNSSR